MKKPDRILDSWLVLEYQSGQNKALALLVKRWHSIMCKQAYWYTKDKDIAKDIAQDSWKIIINKLYSLKDTNKFGSWALAIVNRKAIDWIRRNKKKFEKLKEYYEDEKIYSNKTIININEVQKLKQAILMLPEGQQIVLKLFYTEEYSLIEICEILGLSLGTVKSRLFYAREKLKTIIKNRNYD